MLVERFQKKLSQFGEAFTVGSNTYRGIFKILDSGTLNSYLDSVEAMGVTKPGLSLVTQADAIINVNNTIIRDGRTYTVLKTALHKIGDTAVFKMVILS